MTGPKLLNYTYAPCEVPAQQPVATTTLPREIALGKSAPVEFRGVPVPAPPAGAARARWGAAAAWRAGRVGSGEAEEAAWGPARCQLRRGPDLHATPTRAPLPPPPPRCRGPDFSVIADPECSVFYYLPFTRTVFSIPNGTLPYLIPYLVSFAPAKPRAGGTLTVTIGVRNDGTADGKVGRGRAHGLPSGARALCRRDPPRVGQPVQVLAADHARCWLRPQGPGQPRRQPPEPILMPLPRPAGRPHRGLAQHRDAREGLLLLCPHKCHCGHHHRPGHHCARPRPGRGHS
jgi:hypothetical protein